ncbi:YbgC/FadM family acyl-CoA thioesterase [Sphingomonas sp. AR_OL41]|uniref:YbgC/FadM family acyl-CoA thioesterase n=1 Tax=Sphingomonas sp. AR_OL41 TaxID=3042729 RepID=UPI0024809FA1|nr:YbgC/FadM family acyl-CoA thioesterase [Sphingomonas sp. AR_OL41]MDH7974327.1 YbgC/FadM family acyl-CoA thioesterase [Sphingomonas sp. AR_OL41]
MPASTEDQPLEGRFDGPEHRFPLRVYFEDTDLTGVVYHANYLRYMERARSDMLRLLGIDHRDAIVSGAGGYAVSALTIRYLRPATLDDMLVVVSSLTQLRAATAHIQQRVMRGDTILTDAEVTVALVGPTGRPRRQPPAWIAAFDAVLVRGEDQA